MSSEKKSGFGGIFKKLGEMAMTPEYLENLKKNQPVQEDPIQEKPVEAIRQTGKTVFATSTPIVFNPSSISSTPNQADVQKMTEKIYNFLESINKPGVDFLEFWNAVEAMEGGVVPANIKNAFVAIKMMSGNAVTKDVLLSTGNAYVSELTDAINQDIAGKTKTKKDLQKSLDLEKVSLESQIKSLRDQIQTLDNELKQKESALSQINGKYAPQMQEVDSSITCGSTALNLVINEIKNFIALIEQNIQ
jgi:hypothetical protein